MIFLKVMHRVAQSVIMWEHVPRHIFSNWQVHSLPEKGTDEIYIVTDKLIDTSFVVPLPVNKCLRKHFAQNNLWATLSTVILLVYPKMR